MRVGLLGPLELGTGTPALGPRDRLVLAALAMRRGQWMAADALADVLWTDQPPATWVKVVQGCVSRLRRALGSESIETSPSGYRLRPESVELDVAELEDLVARARSGLADGAAERAVAGFEKALGLWRGRPLTELEEWPPAQLEAARLTELHLAAEEERLTAMLAAGRHQEVVGEALVQARQQPWREGRWVTLALAQYRCGRQADALASIRSARRILGQQLGLDPGSELAELEHKILEQSPSLAADHEVKATSAACPWRGLASYDAEDVDTFFGREDDVAACLARLVDSRLLVLAGPSGSGKSSLMKAGLIPALALQGRSSVVCTPGADPVGAIAAARAGSTTPDVVLCVDQAEEALAGRAEDLVLWLRALIGHADDRGPVIITLRADHLPALALDPEFARLAERGLYLVSPLADDQLRRVIEEPARVAGLRLEHGLVDLMLRDAEDQPGALPLLSHALAETWGRRDGSLLTVEGYRESGGISGAVAASADRVYSDLSDQQRGQLRWLMLRMAGLADAGEPVRTPVGRDVALSDPDRARVLDLLVRTRLVTSDQGQYELAHEALVRAWPRLRTWLEEDQVGQRVWRHLATSAAEWDRLGRPANELYTGVRLESALDWAARPESMPTKLEREFLEASSDRAAAERQLLADQARHERRQNRRLRTLVAGLAVVLIAAMVAGVLAVLQARRADRQSVAAIASAVGAKALKSDDPQLSLLLAAAAEQVAPTADTLRSLSSVIANRPLLAKVASMPQSDGIAGVATTINGVFVMDRRAIVRSFDTQLRPLGTYDAGDGHRATIDPPLAADDDVLVVGAAPGDARPIRLLDPETLTELPHQLQDTPTNVYVIDLSLSADGRRLAVVYSPATAAHPTQENVANTIRVWNLTTGLPAGPPIEGAQALLFGEPTDARWTAAGLSSDGRTVYTSSPVAAYDVATGEAKWKTKVSTWNNLMDVHGDLVATGPDAGDSSGVEIFDAQTGKHTMTLPSDIGSIQDLTFSRDGTMIAATGTTGRATVWDTESWQPLYALDTGGPPLNGGAFSTFGGTLYVAKPFRRELQAWSLNNGPDRFVPRIGFDDIPGYANGRPRLTRDGTRLAIEGWSDPNTGQFQLTIFDLTKEQVFDLPVVGHPSAADGDWLGAGAWAPSDARYAAGYAGDAGGWVQVIDADAGTEANRRRVSDDGIAAVSYAGPDRLVAATQDGHVMLLDAKSLEQVGPTVSLPEGAADAAGFSDGRTALVLGAGAAKKVTWEGGGRTWYRVDLGSGRVVQTGRLTMRQGLVLALAPDERRFAVGGVDGMVEIIDIGSGHAIRPAVSDGAGVIGHLAFDASGDRLAVGADIGKPLGLWDARTGTPLAGTGLVEDLPGTAVAFAADDRVLAASSSGDVYAWDISAAAAIRYACRVANRDLTRQEWSDAFGGGVPYRSTCSGR